MVKLFRCGVSTGQERMVFRSPGFQGLGLQIPGSIFGVAGLGAWLVGLGR